MDSGLKMLIKAKFNRLKLGTPEKGALKVPWWHHNSVRLVGQYMGMMTSQRCTLRARSNLWTFVVHKLKLLFRRADLSAQPFQLTLDWTHLASGNPVLQKRPIKGRGQPACPRSRWTWRRRETSAWPETFRATPTRPWNPETGNGNAQVVGAEAKD